MQEKIPLSVAIITKNEQENLPGCLASAAFAQQIVVVDSGSSDGTAQIASDHGCEVFREDWRGFGPQKQFALDQCRQDWVLVLDADERIPQQTARVIRSLILKPSKDIAGYSFPRKNFFQGRWIRHGGWWPDRVVRLFLRDRGRFTEAAVHEAVAVNGTVEALGWPLEHFTESDFSALLQKLDRYSTLGARAAFDEGRSATIWEAFFRAELTFLQDYVVKAGFLDGAQGLTLAVTDAVNKFFKYAKLYQLRREATWWAQGDQR